MAKILSVTSGFPSILYPSVELARRLAVVGHRLTFSGLAESRELVEHHGIDFLPLVPSRYESFLEEDARASRLDRLLDLRRRRARATESLAVTGFARTVRDLGPDLILIDGEMHAHVIAAATTGLPIALLNSFASIWRRPGLPPPHCLVRPGRGWQGSRVGIWLLWRALGLRKWRRALSLWVRHLGCDRLSILRQLARDSGFDWHLETDASQWLMPFTYRRFPVLSLHAREFDFPHHPPRQVHYVGPMLLASRIDRAMTEQVRSALDAILARRRAQEDSKLIYAGFGSVFSTDLALLKRLVEIVRERPHWHLVISLSDRVSRADLGRLPDRVHAFPWVPQGQVLRHADAAVTHGGINTIDECVLNGVPMLVYCGFETDMAGNTARVVHHGIGIAGVGRRDSTAIIRAHIDHLLSEPRFAHNLQRLQRQYAAYEEGLVAEKTVQALLARGAGR